MPTMRVLMRWQSEDQTIRQRIAHAREAQVEKMLEETIRIADDATDDAEIWTDPKTKRQYARLNGSSTKRAALQIATRESFAKMMLPERFAMTRTDITSGGKALPAPVQHNDNRIVALLQLAASRASELKAVGGQTIDVTPLSLDELMS